MRYVMRAESQAAVASVNDSESLGDVGGRGGEGCVGRSGLVRLRGLILICEEQAVWADLRHALARGAWRIVP